MRIKYTNRLKEIRARHNVTQQELASFIGIGTNNYSKKEKQEQQWKEKEMHLAVAYFNYYHEERFQLDDLFSALVDFDE